MSEPSSGGKNRVQREARLRWVPIALMRVSPLAQRDLNPGWASHLAANLDLEQIGTPTVNHRDGSYWIVDGQHRVEAFREIGWGDQQIQCQVYEGLTEDEEAEYFLKLNDKLSVTAFAKFRVGVQAGRDVECDIDRIVRANGLCVSQNKTPGAISAVGTLRRLYNRAGPGVLARTLGIVRDAYGDAGLEAPVIDGIGILCQRYGDELDVPTVVSKLASAHGGVNGLLGKAEILRRSSGTQRMHCVAAAAVEIINSGRGGKKLPAYWRSETARLKSVGDVA